MNMFKPTSAKTPLEYLAMIDEPRRFEVTEIFGFSNQLLRNNPPYVQTGMIGWLPFHYDR